jgi:hypothetical protein
MRNLEFHTPEGTVLKYGTGQGMGLYSSWTSMAWTHHVLVRLAAYQSTGESQFSDYLVLGDDVVIASEKVATQYCLLIELIGVSISTPKSVFPSTVRGVEFASKLITEEENLSPLPLGCLLTKTPLSIFTLWDSIYKRSGEASG